MSKIHKPSECFVANHTYIMNHIVIEPVHKKHHEKIKVPSDDFIRQEEDKKLLEEIEKKANKIIEDAKEEAQQILLKAKQDAILIVDEARQNAYDEGFEQGKMDGLHEFDNANFEIQSIINEMGQEKNKFIGELEQEILKLSVNIAEKIIGQQINVDDTKFLSIISNAIQKASSTEKISISVCPLQYDKMMEWKKIILSQVKNIKVIDVIQDEFLNFNDCLIDTDCGIIDAGVSTQISKISQVFELEKTIS